MKIKFCHLYPDLLNLYGDQGNILVLYRRAVWRDMEVEITTASAGDKVDLTGFDLVFIGGGSDNEQGIIASDLREKGSQLIKAVQNGTVLLSICGGYQLLGRYYQTRDGSRLPGVGLFDCWTEAGEERLEGNVLLTTSGIPPLKPATLIGFENHSGRTFLGKGVSPLGWTKYGKGNNGLDGTEGATRDTAFGTYLHGPLLAKNPHFADYLLKLSIQHSKGDISLPCLNDFLEWKAHEIMKDRISHKKDRL